MSSIMTSIQGPHWSCVVRLLHSIMFEVIPAWDVMSQFSWSCFTAAWEEKGAEVLMMCANPYEEIRAFGTCFGPKMIVKCPVRMSSAAPLFRHSPPATLNHSASSCPYIFAWSWFISSIAIANVQNTPLPTQSCIWVTHLWNAAQPYTCL